MLDVGCGTGRLGAHVTELVAPLGEVVGVDPLPLRVEIANRKHPRVTASVGRAEDLSAVADASFDVVYLNSVFHWVSDKPRALGEILRVLKPGGRIGVNSADAKRAHQSAVLVRDAVLEETCTIPPPPAPSAPTTASAGPSSRACWSRRASLASRSRLTHSWTSSATWTT